MYYVWKFVFHYIRNNLENKGLKKKEKENLFESKKDAHQN
jgi:hypothetical protein